MKQSEHPYKKAFFYLLYTAASVGFLILALPRLLRFFLPFVIGAILAWIANPLVRFFERHLKIKRRAGSAVVIAVVLAAVVLVMYWAVSAPISESANFIAALPRLWQDVEGALLRASRRLDELYDGLPRNAQAGLDQLGDRIGAYIEQLPEKLGVPTVNAVGNFAKGIPGAIIGVIMTLLSAYFFVADKDEAVSFLNAHLSEGLRKKWGIVKKSLKSGVGGYFKAQLKIEVWIFLLLLIGFWLLRISYGPVIAFLIAVLDFLPFLGAGAVMIPWAAVEFLGENYRMGIWLLIIWGVGQLARQIIQPKIVGDLVGIRPLPTLFLLFVGYKFAGVLGMILSVPIGIIIQNMNQAGIFDTLKRSLRILAEGLAEYESGKEED